MDTSSSKEFPSSTPLDQDLYPPSPLTADSFQTMGYEDKPPAKHPADIVGLWLVVGGVAVMVVYTWVLVFSNNPSALKYFAVHPPFQTLAFGLFAAGILTLQPTSMAQPRAKARGFQRHQIIMLGVAFPILLVGSLAIIYNKYVNESPHFASWHGTLGIIALVWVLLQIAVGGGSVWFKGRAFGKDPKRVYKYHRVSGYLLLTLFLLVIHVGGAWSNFSVKNGHLAMRVIAYAVCPIAILVGVSLRARPDKMKLF